MKLNATKSAQRWLICLATFLSLLVTSPALVSGDEVVISEATYSALEAGGFDCEAVRQRVRSVLPFHPLDQKCCELTAGELWTFFNSQGFHSMEELVLCLDVPTVENANSVGFSSIKFQIEDPFQKGEFITSVDNGKSTIILPGYDSSSMKPEARLKFDLGYDFMERFSKDSTEKIKLNFSYSSQEAAAPTFFLEGDRDNLLPNFGILAAFVACCIAVLTILFFFTRPRNEPNQPNTTNKAIAA